MRIECDECKSESVVYTMAKSTVNCNFCGNILARPGGGRAVLFGRLRATVDGASDTVKPLQPGEAPKPARLLLDTVIIHKIINGAPVHELAGAPGMVVLDRILIETVNMEKDRFDVTTTPDELVEKLGRFGDVEKVTVDHALPHVIAARDLAESKKYANADGVPLSETDCILLETALVTDGVRLVTDDKTLASALETERGLRGNRP